jgi:hypothetical protein
MEGDESSFAESPALRALVQRDEAEPVALQELREAQRSLINLLKASVWPALEPGVFSGATAEPNAQDADSSAAQCHRGLVALAELWQKEALRPLLTARHLPLELAALLQLLRRHGPAGAESAAARYAWCEQRLDALLAGEPPLALIESFVALLRQPRAPPWLRSACSARLPRCILRPDGVQSLLLSLCAHQSSEADRVAAGLQAVRLLSTTPATMDAHAYISALAPQLLPLLTIGDELTAQGEATSAQATNGTGGTGVGGMAAVYAAPNGGAAHRAAEAVADEMQQRVLRSVAALSVGALVRRAPNETNAYILRPIVHGVRACDEPAGATAAAPLAAAPRVTDGRVADGRTADCALSVRRIARLVTSSPPPSADLCTALVRAGALDVLLRLCVHAH